MEQRYYLNRRQFTNAWANYLDPFARMHLILYKSAFVYESEDDTTIPPDAAGLVTNEDRSSVPSPTPDAHFGAWYYTQDIPGAIQVSMDIRGEGGCGANDHGARLYPSITTASKADLLQVIWQKDKFKEWLIQDRRGPLGNPRYWYTFNLMPEVEGCASLGANADSIADVVNAVRAYTLLLDDVRDTVEQDYELRVRPGLALFGPQAPLRDHNQVKSVTTSDRYPEGWWYGLLDETTSKESDEQTNNSRLGLYIRILRQLAAAENFDGGNLLSDADWSPTEAKLFQEFYLYNVQDYYRGPSASNGPFVSATGTVMVTPIPVATLQVDGENAAMSMIYTAADLYMMNVIPDDIDEDYTQETCGANRRPSIAAQFGMRTGTLKDCVRGATLEERYKCRLWMDYTHARMLQPLMQRFEDQQDQTFTLPNTNGTPAAARASEFLVGVSYWTPITIPGFVYDEVIPLQHFNYLDTGHEFSAPLLDWWLVNDIGGDIYGTSFSPLGRVFLRGAAGFFTGPYGTSYPSSSSTIYNIDAQASDLRRFADPWWHGAATAVPTKTNDFSDWERNVRASVSFSGGNVTGTCTIDGFNPTNGVVYFLRDLSVDTYLTSKAAGTFSNGSLSDGSESTSPVAATSGHTYQLVCYNKDDYTNRNMESKTAP